MSNPFYYGNPATPDQFVGRRRELRRVTGRIVNQGQSTAVVGEPRSGKTSLLLYIAAQETREELYGADGGRLMVSYMDAQTLGGEFSQARFWEYALSPFVKRTSAHGPGSSLVQVYETCQESAFGAFELERLFAQTRPTGWRLVLIVDEFDVLLHHPILSCSEFFGSLRSLASRSQGALALVIASRRSLTNLNDATQRFSRTGSPYFNFLSEITLGRWPDKDVAELLRRAGGRFATADRRFIAEVAGGHPYLTQVAASTLWDAYKEGKSDPYRRRKQAGRSLYDEAALTLGDTWRLWQPAMRRAFAAVALVQVPYLLRRREFDMKRLLHDTRDFRPELRSLEKQGFVTEDEDIPGGWRVRPQVFLWWLADELVRAVRDDPSLRDWLRKQEWEGLLTRGEKDRLVKAIRAIGGLLKDSAATLIEAAAKVMAKGS